VKVSFQSENYVITDSHPFSKTIRAICRAYEGSLKARKSNPEGNGIIELWERLGTVHRRLLKIIAARPAISQADLQVALGLAKAEDLRGARNGAARIGAKIGVDNPISTWGSTAETRRYKIQDKDIAATILKLDETL